MLLDPPVLNNVRVIYVRAGVTDLSELNAYQASPRKSLASVRWMRHILANKKGLKVTPYDLLLQPALETACPELVCACFSGSS